MTFEEIINFDDQIFEIIEHNPINYQSFYEKKGFNSSGEALFSLTTRMGFIKNSIFEIAAIDDLYSSNILFRVLLEHHLKFTYIILRLMEEKKDAVGIDYIKIYRLFEEMKMFKIKERQWEITYNEWKQKFPELKNIAYKQANEIYKNFSNSQIIEFLNKLKKPGEEVPFINKILPRYSELSSFVHGGPYATIEMVSFTEPSARLAELENICVLTLLIHLNNFMLMSIPILNNSEIEKSFHKFNGLFDKVSSASPIL